MVLPTIAIFLSLAALIACVTGVALWFPGPAWLPLWNLNPRAYESFHRLGWIAPAILFSLAGICAVTAFGLFQHRRWAWWIAVVLFAANGAGDLASLFLSGELLRFGSGVLIAAVFVFLLALSPVRRSLR